MADVYEWFDVYERSFSSTETLVKKKVAIFGHKRDHQAMIEVAKDLLEVFECTVLVQRCFDEKDFGSTIPASFSEISLFVIVISERFMGESSYAGRHVVPYAQENTRIMPVLIDDAEGLGRWFNRKYDKLHILRRKSDDYYDHLKSYISKYVDGHYLIGLNSDQIRMKENLFKLKAFISYRKKDAEFMRKVLDFIYTIPEMLDMAVFYDSALVPGERYDNRLRKEISESDVVIFIITPNILEEGNFAATKEYPQAVAEKKILLPVMIGDTDVNAVGHRFPAFERLVNFNDTGALTSILVGIRSRFGNTEIGTAEEKFFLGYAYAEGEGTVINREVSDRLFKEATSEGSGLAALKVAQRHLIKGNGVIDAETGGMFRKAMLMLDDRLSQMNMDDKSSLAIADALASAADYSCSFAFSDYDHDRIREAIECMLRADVCLRKDVGIFCKYTTMPFIHMGNMYFEEGNLDIADMYFTRASKELSAYIGATGNSFYSRLKQGLILSGQGRLLVLLLRRGEWYPRVYWEAKKHLEGALKILILLICSPKVYWAKNHLEGVTDLLKYSILKDYYYIGMFLDRIREEEASMEVFDNLLQTVPQILVNQRVSSVSDLHEIFYDPDMFHIDLNISSVKERKEKLDSITDWFVMDASVSELAQMFTFQEEFADEGVWGSVKENYVETGYKCHKCNSRLYKVVFPEGNDPELFLSPSKTKYISPARVFTCPRCAHFYAVPKGRKLIEGPVYATQGYSWDNESGRAVYATWLHYFDTIGDINARRNE